MSACPSSLFRDRLLGSILSRASAETNRVYDLANALYPGKTHETRIFIFAVSQMLRSVAIRPSDEELMQYLDSRTENTQA